MGERNNARQFSLFRSKITACSIMELGKSNWDPFYPHVEAIVDVIVLCD